MRLISVIVHHSLLACRCSTFVRATDASLGRRFARACFPGQHFTGCLLRRCIGSSVAWGGASYPNLIEMLSTGKQAVAAVACFRLQMTLSHTSSAVHRTPHPVHTFGWLPHPTRTILRKRTLVSARCISYCLA